MKSGKLKLSFNCVGGVLTLASIGFVVHRLAEYWSGIPDGTFTYSLWLIVFALSVVYFCANFLLSLAWSNLLVGLNIQIDFKQSNKIYSVTQLAKYVPGNVFQFAGRQVIMMGEGYSGHLIAKSGMLELVLLVLAGVLCGALVLPFFSVSIVFPYNILLLMLSAFFVFYVNRKLKLIYYNRTLMYYFIFLIISAGIFVSVIQATAGLHNPSLSFITFVMGAYIIAWLIGLVTPGSPAGIGIREVVLFFFLKSYYPESVIVLAIIIGRIITVFGDFLFYLSSWIKVAKKNEKR
jgi:hypothetical protein